MIYSLVIFFVVGVTAERNLSDQPIYSSQYDYIDVDRVLSNSRLYNRYLDCLMGTGKCSPDARELRDKLPEALLTNCEKCNEKQRNESHRVISYLMRQKPEDFKKLEEKYDPTGVYRRRFDAENGNAASAI